MKDESAVEDRYITVGKADNVLPLLDEEYLDDGVKVNYEKFQGVEVAQEGKKALKIDLLAKI